MFWSNFGFERMSFTNNFRRVSDVFEPYNLFFKHKKQLPKCLVHLYGCQISKLVKLKIKSLSDESSIPFTSHRRVIEKIRSNHAKCQILLKPYNGRKDHTNYQMKIEAFRKEMSSRLFDIAFCKCRDFDLCNCQKDKKIAASKDYLLQINAHKGKCIFGALHFFCDITAQIEMKNVFEEYTSS